MHGLLRSQLEMLLQEHYLKEKHNKSSFMMITFFSVQINCNREELLIIKSLEKCHYKQSPVFSVSMCMSYGEIYIHSSSNAKGGDPVELIANKKSSALVLPDIYCS